MTGPPDAPAVAPEPDLESAAYWAGLRRHRIVLQQCDSCGRIRFPPMPGCPYCGAPGGRPAEASGEGRIYSWIRVHRALTPAMAGEVPYVIATVDLDAGPRLFGRLAGGGHDPVTPGDRVVAEFVDHEAWTELRFRRRPDR